MTAAAEAFSQVVTPELDDALRCVVGLDEDPSWLVMCSGQVMRTTLVRRRPNGTVWIEAQPVDVDGFNNPPRRVPGTVELRRRTAVAIARVEGLKERLLKAEAAEVLAPIIGSMSAAQLEGLACAYCHRPALEGGPMVPLKVLAGLEFTGAHNTLFVCDPDCRTPEPDAEAIIPRPCMHKGYHQPGQCPEANAQPPFLGLIPNTNGGIR
jgi:hypothetical protein